MKNERVIAMDDHGCYFLTLETVDLIDIFIRPMYKQIVVHTLNHYIDSKGLTVYAWCLMSSRLHIICQADKGRSLKEIRYGFKQFTTEKIIEAIGNEPAERREWLLKHFEKPSGFLGTNRKVELWRPVKEIVSIDLTRPDTAADHFELIHNMPVKERVVRYASDFLYSSAFDYETGSAGLINITRPATVEAALDELQNRKSIFKTKFGRQ